MPVKSDPARAPNPIDIHVGLQVRLRRKALKISQEKLADSLGLTFQQVQKYERGANRISASKLYEIAAALRTPVSYFFEGLADPSSESEGDEKFHAEEPPVGFVEVTTPGRYSPPDMPTQRSALGHEIDPM